MHTSANTFIKSIVCLYLLTIVATIAGTAQATIAASTESITIEEYTFSIVKVAFDSNALGFAPPDMGPNEKIIFVEFELKSGSSDDFKDLTVQMCCDAGSKFKPVLLTAGGVIKMLASVTIKGRAGRYRPQKDNIAWAYVIPQKTEVFHLHFPSGEIIDLAPLLHK
jgi:hypothetical protein